MNRTAYINPSFRDELTKAGVRWFVQNTYLCIQEDETFRTNETAKRCPDCGGPAYFVHRMLMIELDGESDPVIPSGV